MTNSRVIPAHFVDQRLSGFQRRPLAVLCSLVALFAVLGKHDVTASSQSNLAMHMSPDDLATSVDAGSPARQIAFIILLAGSAIAFLAGNRRDSLFQAMLKNNLPLACFAGLASASLAWSTDPALTARRLAEFIIMCIAARAAGGSLGRNGVLWLGFIGSSFYLLIGVISEIALGTFRPLAGDYRFYGTLYPTQQSWNCVLLLITGSFLCFHCTGIRRVWCTCFMILGVVCLVLTKSRTALCCGGIALLFYWSNRLSAKGKIVLALLVLSVLSALGLMMVAKAPIISAVDHALLAGREEDTYQNLSGRVPLWQLCMGYAEQHPYTGYGFDSFWTPDRINTVSAKSGWAVPMAHNGYLELVLDVGLIGLGIYLWQLATSWSVLRNAWRVTGSAEIRSYWALLLFYVLCMTTETIAFDVGLPTFCVLTLFWWRKEWFASSQRSARHLDAYTY